MVKTSPLGVGKTRAGNDLCKGEKLVCRVSYIWVMEHVRHRLMTPKVVHFGHERQRFGPRLRVHIIYISTPFETNLLSSIGTPLIMISLASLYKNYCTKSVNEIATR